MIKKGDIYYANLGSRLNSHVQGGNRPVLILQNDVGNSYSDTTIVTPLTSKSKKQNYQLM